MGMVRCYDCGQPVPDDDLVRRDIIVGRTGGPYIRIGRGRRGYIRRVNLCPECALVRDNANRTGMFIILIFLVVALCLTFAFFLCLSSFALKTK